MLIAHRNDFGDMQNLGEHAEGTAELAAIFAAPFQGEGYARMTALAHDIGKASREFQKRILENGPRVDHSTAGAQALWKLGMVPAAFCAAGHHGGLPNGGSRGDKPQDPTIFGRIQRDSIPDYSRYTQEGISLQAVPAPPIRDTYEQMFFTRMLYSCLVDADYLDTEAFMQRGRVERGRYESLAALLQKLQAHTAKWWPPVSGINRKRCEILQRCIAAGKAGERGLYSLTVPTGGGKTVASLAFALHHGVERGLSRVIYVVPYTSIIQQTAKVFREILGAGNVLEHHSSVAFDPQGDDDPLQEKLRLSTENWDAPVIVTTNVQFFESLYGNRSSRCRKLHNIANSVVIFDEAQMLPVDLLKPCVKAVETLVRSYGVSALLCTATQPALEGLFHMPIREICPDRAALYAQFRRVTLVDMGRRELGEIAAAMGERSLCIVNSRSQAAELYKALPEEGRFHLSTRMIPLDRSAVLEAVRGALGANRPCRVAATSLVEAGVDLDFPQVYREAAGLDSILQAAGRCNRENKNPPEDSRVYVFTTDKRPPRAIAQNVAVFHETARRYPDIAAPEAVEAYFRALYDFHGEGLDRKRILEITERGIDGCIAPFAAIAELFHIIDSRTYSVLVPVDAQAAGLGEDIRRGDITRAKMRLARQYMLQVDEGELQALYRDGVLERLGEDLFLLADSGAYSREMGLAMHREEYMGKGIHW